MGALPDVRGLSAAEVIAIITQLAGRKNIALGELAKKGWLEWYGKLWGFGSSGEIVVLPQDGSGSAPVSAPSSLPVTETKNSYIWEKAYEETVSGDATPGTIIFDGRSLAKSIITDDCDDWAFIVRRNSGGAGVATVDISLSGSMDGVNWISSSPIDTNVTIKGESIPIPYPGKYALYYNGKYVTVYVKVNTQGADLFTIELWRRRKQ